MLLQSTQHNRRAGLNMWGGQALTDYHELLPDKISTGDNGKDGMTISYKI